MNTSPTIPSVLALLLVACSSGTPSTHDQAASSSAAPSSSVPSASTGPSASAAPASPAAAAPGVEVVLNGKKLTLQSALVHSYGGQDHKITLSTAPLTCEHVKARGRGLLRDEQTIDISIAPPLQGAKGQSIVTLSYPMTTGFPSTLSFVSETIKPLPASAGGRVKAALNLEQKQPADADLKRPEQSVSVKGDLDLMDCGAFSATEKGSPDPQAKLKVQVNGEEIAIKGAILVPYDKDQRLFLTSETSDCSRDSFADIGLELVLSPGAAAPKGMVLVGARLVGSSQSNLEKQMKGIRSDMPKVLPAAGQKAAISLDGTINLPASDGEYRVTLAGVASALVCPR